MLKATKNNIIFLDYDDADDSEGAFRATFQFDTFDQMLQSIEAFTETELTELVINPNCYDKFECSKPEWIKFQWDLYNGKIKLLNNYSKFSIGDFWWKGLYQKKIRPDCSQNELTAWIEQDSNSDLS